MKMLFRLIHGTAGLLDSLYARGLQGPPAVGDAEALELRAVLGAGDWRSAAAALAKRPQDFARRVHLVQAAAEWPKEPAWLQQWLRSEPRSAEPWLVAGAMWTQLGWAARGAGFAQTVSETGAMQFFKRLEQAKQALHVAGKAAPDDPTPWALLLPIARGLNEAPEAVRGWFQNVVSRSAQHFFAHQEMLQYTCAKWHGSDEAMWDFAREAASSAPSGSPLHALIAEAHMEEAWNLASDSPEPDATEQGYWSRAQVLAGASRAYRSFRSAQTALTPDRVAALSDFAYALWRCGARDLAAEAFERLGTRLTRLPWGVHPCAAKTFCTARRACGVR